LAVPFVEPQGDRERLWNLLEEEKGFRSFVRLTSFSFTFYSPLTQGKEPSSIIRG
jgi:hypothetical protein